MESDNEFFITLNVKVNSFQFVFCMNNSESNELNSFCVKHFWYSMIMCVGKKQCQFCSIVGFNVIDGSVNLLQLYFVRCRYVNQLILDVS